MRVEKIKIGEIWDGEDNGYNEAKRETVLHPGSTMWDLGCRGVISGG